MAPITRHAYCSPGLIQSKFPLTLRIERSTDVRWNGTADLFCRAWLRENLTRLLLADSHAFVRQGLRALLERHGHHVISEASDVHEALRLASKTSFDVEILDVTMPILAHPKRD